MVIRISICFSIIILHVVDETLPRSINDEIENQDLTVQIKVTSGSWWRIIKLGKQEWILYILGFAFLLIAASSMIITHN